MTLFFIRVIVFIDILKKGDGLLNKNCYDNIDIILTPNEISYKTEKGVLSKKIDLSIKDIRNQLNNIGFRNPYNHATYNEYYSREIERYNIPYMNFIYYYLFYRLLRIPTLEEFTDTYLQIYCDRITDEIYTIKPFFDNSNFSFTKKQLLGRVFRSYNSFHREVEFLFQMKEYDGIDISYSFQDDLSGIDFTVKYNDKTFGIASYIDSYNSNKWKNVKNERRHNYDDKNMINVVAHFKDGDPDYNCKSYNGIFTYSHLYVAEVFFEIVKKSEQ